MGHNISERNPENCILEALRHYLSLTGIDDGQCICVVNASHRCAFVIFHESKAPLVLVTARVLTFHSYVPTVDLTDITDMRIDRLINFFSDFEHSFAL